jgi:hypothetical protein
LRLDLGILGAGEIAKRTYAVPGLSDCFGKAFAHANAVADAKESWRPKVKLRLDLLLLLQCNVGEIRHRRPCPLSKKIAL